MNEHNQRLWLKWNTVLKQILHIKWQYTGTREKETIEDMASYIKKLMNELEEK